MPLVHTYKSRAKWEEIKNDTGKSKCQRQHEQCIGKAISHYGAKFSASLLSMLMLLLSFWF